jgi:phosphonate transport system substrate-binding protein
LAVIWRTATVVAALLAGVAGAPADGRADWQDTHQALRIGFLTTSGAVYDMRRLEPFRLYLQQAAGMPVELVPTVSYSALIDAQATDRVQYVIHSATSFVTTVANCRCVEPLALPAAFDGATGFHAVILARADGPIRSLADARGARLAVTRGDSVAGRLLPLKYLAREGIDPAAELAAVVEAPDPATAIAALLAGQVDLAVGWSSLTGDAAMGYDFGVLTALVAGGSVAMADVRIVWQSPLVPFGPHALRSDVPDELRARLLAALTAMAVDAPDALDTVDRASIGGGGFVAVERSAYAPVADLVGAIAGDPDARPTAEPDPLADLPSVR